MPLSSKQLLEESRARRTWRKFLPDAVDMDVIRDCILTAGTAPTAPISSLGTIPLSQIRK